MLYLERASVVAVGQKLPGLVSQLGNFLRKLSFGGERLLKEFVPCVQSQKAVCPAQSRFDEHLVVNWVAKFKAGERCHLFVWVFLFLGGGVQLYWSQRTQVAHVALKCVLNSWMCMSAVPVEK